MVTPKRRKFNIRLEQKRRTKRKLVLHFLLGKAGGREADPFNDLQTIAKKGFFRQPEKATVPNVHLKGHLPFERFNVSDFYGCEPSSLNDTMGDKYAIEMRAKTRHYLWNKGQRRTLGDLLIVDHAHPGQLKKIYIRISP